MPGLRLRRTDLAQGHRHERGQLGGPLRLVPSVPTAAERRPLPGGTRADPDAPRPGPGLREVSRPRPDPGAGRGPGPAPRLVAPGRTVRLWGHVLARGEAPVLVLSGGAGRLALPFHAPAPWRMSVYPGISRPCADAESRIRVGGAGRMSRGTARGDVARRPSSPTASDPGVRPPRALSG